MGQGSGAPTHYIGNLACVEVDSWIGGTTCLEVDGGCHAAFSIAPSFPSTHAAWACVSSFDSAPCAPHPLPIAFHYGTLRPPLRVAAAIFSRVSVPTGGESSAPSCDASLASL